MIRVGLPEWSGRMSDREVAQITRVVLVRTGIVLDRRGGALPKMLPPFWFGAGGPVGAHGRPRDRRTG